MSGILQGLLASIVAAAEKFELYTWGSNTFGQLGVGDTTNRSSPVQVSGTDWGQLSVGREHMGAVKTDNTLWMWGNNNASADGLGYGRLGDGTTSSKSSPIQIGALTNWASVVAARRNSGAIRLDGTLWTWGDNINYQLGTGSGTPNRSSPVNIGATESWAQLAIAPYHSAAITTDGELYTWGSGTWGKLGQGDLSSRYVPTRVGSLTNWAQVAGGYLHTMAVKTDGTLWAVGGRGGDGRLGTGSTATVSSPIQVGALTNWAQVATGRETSLAVKTDGTLWGWGSNSSGQVGDGTTTTRSSPVQIGALTNWLQTAMTTASFAVKTDGTLWSWGPDTGGILGETTPGNLSSPGQIGSLANWVQVSTGYGNAGAVAQV